MGLAEEGDQNKGKKIVSATGVCGKILRRKEETCLVARIFPWLLSTLSCVHHVFAWKVSYVAYKGINEK